MGRDTETSALVRCDAYPPDWSPREGPSEFAHWLLHTEQSRPCRYTVADGPGGRQVVWTGGSEHSLPCPVRLACQSGQTTRAVADERGPADALQRAKRCTVDLGELEQAWSDWG